MGEATYYLKATFPAGVDMGKIEEIVNKFCKEMARFDDAWQDIRHSAGTPMERAMNLKAQFPQVWEGLKLDRLEIKPDDVVLNEFAGELDMTEDFNLYVEGNVVKLHDTVWHMATWGPLAEWFESIGATKATWLSDEELDPFSEME